jgi:hypothetical protein
MRGKRKSVPIASRFREIRSDLAHNGRGAMEAPADDATSSWKRTSGVLASGSALEYLIEFLH